MQKEAAIKKGVTQRCSLSPLLFNLFVKYTLHNIKDKGRAGLNNHGDFIFQSSLKHPQKRFLPNMKATKYGPKLITCGTPM